MKDDWFRKNHWTESDHADFFNRLGRARSDSNKAQYLRIQAWHLAQGKQEMLSYALELLNELLTHYSRLQIAPAYQQMGQIYERLGNIDEALDYYSKALEAEEKFPNVQTNVYLDLALLVISKDLKHWFGFAKEALRQRDNAFPVSIYQKHGCLAILEQNCGQNESARAHAQLAIEAARRKDSGFTWHKKLGLVEDTNTAFHRRIVEIARSTAD